MKRWLRHQIARSRRQSRERKFSFLTGLDEHGQKVQQAAQANGKNAAADYCDGGNFGGGTWKLD